MNVVEGGGSNVAKRPTRKGVAKTWGKSLRLGRKKGEGAL